MTILKRRRDEHGMALAAEYAEFSSDPSTQNGAIIVTSGSFVAGWNQPPLDSLDSSDVIAAMTRVEKLHMMEHAERSAILRAAKYGVCTDGATMYTLWAACPDCARAIVFAGISRVVVWGKLLTLTPQRWQHSVASGLAILQSAGVKVEEWVGEIATSTTSIRFDGRAVSFAPLPDSPQFPVSEN